MTRPFEEYAKMPAGLSILAPHPQFNNEPFSVVVGRTKTADELYTLVHGKRYEMSGFEQRCYDRRLEALEEEESIARWTIEECAKITHGVESINLEKGSVMSREQMDTMIASYLEEAVEMEKTIRLQIKATLSLKTLRFERDERRQRDLIDSMVSINDAALEEKQVEKIIHFSKRHQFLHSLLGPTLLRKFTG